MSRVPLYSVPNSVSLHWRTECTKETMTRKHHHTLAAQPAQQNWFNWTECNHLIISTFSSLVLFLVICAATGRAPSTIGILFQKYVYSTFSMKMVLNLCSYLVCRFVFGQGYGARKEIDQNSLSVIWLCSKFALAWDFWPLGKMGSVGWT